MIKEMSRGWIRAQYGDKTVTIEGEGLVRMEGEPDYVIYADSIRSWDKPDGGAIDESTKKTIVADIVEELEKKGVKVAID